jgi:hypothetical protein
MLFLHQRVLLKKKVMNLQYYHLMLLTWEGTTVSTISGSKRTTRRTEKEKKEKKQRKEEEKKDEIKEKLQATTSYCKGQDWTFAS